MPDITPATTEARDRAERIRAALPIVANLITDIGDAWTARDWEILGYDSWTAYVEGERFPQALAGIETGKRPELMVNLRDLGMSYRAISAATGASKDTVQRDVIKAGAGGVSDETPGRVTGQDGKSYPGAVGQLDDDGFPARRDMTPNPPRAPRVSPVIDDLSVLMGVARRMTGAIRHLVAGDRLEPGLIAQVDGLAGSLAELEDAITSLRQAAGLRRPLLLDLFCGQGGAAMGYYRAGFRVLGVDIHPQPRYPFPFVHADSLAFLRSADLSSVALIHASPPCQRYSVACLNTWQNHPDLLGPTRDALIRTGRPWVIENVPGAPMRPDIRLCGCTVGLPRLRRERWFETSWRGSESFPECFHPEAPVGIAGHGSPSWSRRTLGRDVGVAERRAIMDVGWMTNHGIAQAIPPAYTERIGKLALPHLTAP
jgi:DNA (cytosine-5)-methyltransferase 1